MKETESLFFELIRVAIGYADSLSLTPSNKEWRTLYDIAKKHSLLGVCFAALQRLGADTDYGFDRIGISEMLYLTWMGMAAKIQQRNEVVTKQCAEVQRRLSASELRCCILKGQGVAQVYPEHLRGLRQSGDIDVYSDCGRKKALKFTRSLGQKDVDWDYVHTHPAMFEDTEVELHYRVSVSRNVWTNARLQKFFKKYNEEFFKGSVQLPGGEITIPSDWMNLFYLLQHAYRHLFTEGIGLRQVMDIYFALLSSTLSEEDIKRLKNAVKSFGLDRFAQGIVWVMQRAFGMSVIGVPWVPNQREGEFLLSEIMQSGNFGHQDDRFRSASGGKKAKVWASARRTLHLARHYTGEAMAAPIYYVWHFLWKRIKIITDI